MMEQKRRLVQIVRVDNRVLSPAVVTTAGADDVQPLTVAPFDGETAMTDFFNGMVMAVGVDDTVAPQCRVDDAADIMRRHPEPESGMPRRYVWVEFVR